MKNKTHKSATGNEYHCGTNQDSKTTDGPLTSTSGESLGRKRSIPSGMGTRKTRAKGRGLGNPSSKTRSPVPAAPNPRQVEPYPLRIPKTAKAQAYADTSGLPPSEFQEVETPEALAARGWERLTTTFESEHHPEGWEEREIMQDPEGGLWLVTDWHGQSGIPHRAARRRMEREEAIQRVALACIPEEFHPSFRECHRPISRLETAIQEARAFIHLMEVGSEGGQREGTFVGVGGEVIKAGISSLACSIGKELSDAFYAAKAVALEEKK